MSENVRQMFASIAKNYDSMNDIITFGMHKSWKKKLVLLSGAKAGDKIIDIASGTGDLAIDFKKVVGNQGTVYATDFCAEMLEEIPQKAKNLRLEIIIEQADAMKLTYPDDSFAVASISYGIRNVDNPQTALKEMARIVKPGGKVMVLETGVPSGIFKLFYNIFMKILPIIGRIFAGNKSAYVYLPKTAQKFPYGEEFRKLMQDTQSFKNIKVYAMFFGASYIYEGEVK